MTILHGSDSPDPYSDIISLYDLEHDGHKEDVWFLRNVVQEGPVLEIGCGSGRILEHLASSGLTLYGIDSSKAMLTAARKRLRGKDNVHLQHMSVESLDLPVVFRTAIWPLNVLWHLPDMSAQTSGLRAVRRHLHQDALLVVDLSNPLTMADRHALHEVRLRFQTARDSELVQIFSSARDDEAEQLLHLLLWYDRIGGDRSVRRITTEMRLRYTYRFELEHLLRATGFTIRHVYGSYDLEPYSADSPNLLVVAVAR